jgi:hypothetical protein
VSRIASDGWQQDGWPHERDEHGTCRNCGASKREYHYKLREPVSTVSFEAGYAFAWNLNLDEWYALSDKKRAQLRDDVVYAPNFNKGQGQ